MKIEDAIKESIRQYYSGNAFGEYSKARGSDVKYSMGYFDKIEKEMLNSKPSEDEDEMEEGEEDDS